MRCVHTVFCHNHKCPHRVLIISVNFKDRSVATRGPCQSQVSTPFADNVCAVICPNTCFGCLDFCFVFCLACTSFLVLVENVSSCVLAFFLQRPSTSNEYPSQRGNTHPTFAGESRPCGELKKNNTATAAGSTMGAPRSPAFANKECARALRPTRVCMNS